MERLINGDCYEKIKEIEDNSVDLVITDPPYIVGTVGGDFAQRRTYYGELSGMSVGFDLSIFDELIKKMKKINIYIFCSQKQIPILIDYFVKEHGCNWNLITWHKTNPAPACGNKYLTDTEYCFFARESGVKIYGSYKTKKTYYISPSNVKDKRKYNHPTVKPIEIVKNLIENSSQENDVVLDPFMGSGTTGVASKLNNREFIGIEIDETYFETAKNRIKNAEE